MNTLSHGHGLENWKQCHGLYSGIAEFLIYEEFGSLSLIAQVFVPSQSLQLAFKDCVMSRISDLDLSYQEFNFRIKDCQMKIKFLVGIWAFDNFKSSSMTVRWYLFPAWWKFFKTDQKLLKVLLKLTPKKFDFYMKLKSFEPRSLYAYNQAGLFCFLIY